MKEKAPTKKANIYSGADRRETTRIKPPERTSLLVFALGPQGRIVIEATLLNFSGRGALIEFRDDPPVGGVLTLNFPSSGNPLYLDVVVRQRNSKMLNVEFLMYDDKF